MRNVVVAGLLVVIGLAWGCSGSSAGSSCTDDLDCDQAWVCIENTCQQKECTGAGQCSGDDQFCAPEGVDPDQPDKKFCSGVECKTDTDCDDGQVCNEYKRCVPGGAADVPGDGPQDVIAPEDNQAPEDVPVDTGKSCSPCAADKDCGDTKCYPLGGGTFCFGACKEHTDCPTGWMCYALSNEGKQCIPMAFNCEADCLAAGCPAGKVCNQETGECVDGVDKCGACDQDWDCAEGMRCYQQGKYCAPTCGGATCEAGSSCQEVNTIPMKICVSSSPTCCYGETCANACSGDKPYACGADCCECLLDAHCGAGFKCKNNMCVSDQCQAPTPYLCGNKCAECCNSGHCADKGAGWVCVNNVCKNDDPEPEECEFCKDNPDYPACTQINGIWSCVGCTDDTYCTPPGTCDLTLFACTTDVVTPGEACNACTQNSDCFSSQGTALECDPTAGCCYDPAGWCDGIESFCNSLEGSTCKGLMDFLGGGGIPGGGIPGMPEGMALGLCTCAQPLDMMSLMMCMMGGCPAGGCYGGAVCVDPSILMSLLGGGGAPPTGEGFCINLQSLLGGLGGLPI